MGMASQFAIGNHDRRCRHCGSFVLNQMYVVCRSCGVANQFRRERYASGNE